MSTAALSARLLEWYDRHARILPWRTPPRARRRSDPYRVWLSEVMLQQTTVATVGPYFRRFLEAWPTVADLAAAPVERVLEAWAGLGYYARARNLHRCAQVLVQEHDGRFPSEEVELRKLPGIGRYTGAAVAAIAFERPVVPVDGNVERVVSRLFAIGDKEALHAAAQRLAVRERAGDFAQALMDLGATVCTPRNPQCLICPWQHDCRARREGSVGRFPVKAAKAERPRRQGAAFVLLRQGEGGQLVWVRRRPPRGLLGGMLEVPSTDWTERAPSAATLKARAPADASWRRVPGTVRHVFTHFELTLSVHCAHLAPGVPAPADGQWLDAQRITGLPTVMRKVMRLALGRVDRC